ncbi:MAG: 2-hydroxyglutaryl-CoA dehydratase, component D [Methanolobus sp. T82-4]|nr:MAG: 2-hydroxyglutaryl-CoA dehydratase, component D [Methanolobus sp. T82-4]
MHSFKTPDKIKNSYSSRICQIADERKKGKKVVGTFCLFVPDEIIFAAGADRVILCGGKNETIPIAEQYLPRNICPLVKSSFGSLVNDGSSDVRSCSHFSMVDMVIAENTCDAKKKMYELLENYIPTYVIDLPQRPDSPEALKYFLSELERFKSAMEELTDKRVTEDRLREEIRSSNETRELLHSLYELRKKDPAPISGTEILKLLQRQYFLSPKEFKDHIRNLINEVEKAELGEEHRPRILISGCPMSGGNSKVPEIIEDRGGMIVAEESCTGTRSFWDPVDEDKEPMLALAERYIKIPCSCMSPNDRRVENILELAEEFNIDGVVYYTLQFCHGYNIEKHKVQQALKKAGIPMLFIETDYSKSDVEQIRLRIDAFMEMLS